MSQPAGLHLSKARNSPFTVVCSVAKPLNRSEAKVDLVMVQTLLLFKYNLLCYLDTGFYHIKVTRLTQNQRIGNFIHNCKVAY